LLGDSEILERAETRDAFLDVDLLTDVLRAGLALRAAGFFEELFFFFGLAISSKGARGQAPGKTEA
jgi:hypothetical protein